MNGQEPIPGAVPPDATRLPESTPPNPEGEPKGGIRVEYKQVELLHKLAINKAAEQYPTFDSDISMTPIDDGLFEKEHSFLGGRNGSFDYSSIIYLSGESIGRSGHGFYSHEKVSRIQNILLQKGVRATVDVRRDGQSSILIEKDDFRVIINFGFPSREAEEAQLSTRAKELSPDRTEGSEQPESTQQERESTHNFIMLELLDKQGSLIGVDAHPKLKDQADFEKATAAYAEAYRQAFEALYTEEGQTPPDKTIIFRPPTLDQDALAEIASIEALKPPDIVESQVVQEPILFKDIAGQDAAVAEAQRLVLAINHPEVFERRGVKRPKGILFYGPPGTGKTLIARAVAAEANAVFIEVSAADIGTKWYGESERLMQKVFDRANAAVADGQKVVLFFDELDALAPSREDSHEATRKVVATLLQNMDGMKANPNVTIIAATNRPQDIDPALKRPGRIDKLIQVGLPNAEGRRAILNVHMNKARKAATATVELFAEGIEFGQIDQATEGMSGADLANLINLTLENKVMAELEGSAWEPVSTEDLVNTAKRLGLLKEEKRRIGFTTHN